MGKIIDLTGQKFNRLIVIKRTGKTKNSHSIWLCRCDCGKEKEISSNDFIRGKIKSCGCFRKKKYNCKQKTYDKNFYCTWNNIETRCGNKNVKDYKNYGGRGIKNEWESFEEFKKDMYESYLEHKKNNSYTSINRINNNGNYCKENCNWATIKEQNNNKRKKYN